MYCVKKITDDLTWVGGNDRRISLFEAVYPVNSGVSYNSYLLCDEKTVLFDTVDKAISELFFENIEYALGGRSLDYIVVQHMEPDHSATLGQLLRLYPDVKIVCSQKILTMIGQFFDKPDDSRIMLVKEGDVLETGKHKLTFVMAPMVHWPEVMVTFDLTDRILFSADAFGTFGALNGAIFADEVDFNGEYLAEARRYYCNIVGKYGTQVQALLKKAAGLDIAMICPLHGFVWRRNISDFVDKYMSWSSYKPEEKGVLIAYASVYGNTATAAEILASKLIERGIKTAMYDVSMTHASYIVAEAFRYSHIVFASTTYNAGIFVKMEDLLHDLAAHNIQNRTVAFVENGSWAATSGKLMKEILSGCKDMTFIEETVSLRSALKPEQQADIEALADRIALDFAAGENAAKAETGINTSALFKIPYGLYLLTAKDGKDNGCIVNVVQLITDNPKRIAIAVNKQNLTHDMILKTGVFNVSILTESVPMDTIKHFGFQSGKDVDKFADLNAPRTANGIVYLGENTNAVISAKVISAADNGTHTLFTAEVTAAEVLSDQPSVTYDYYQQHIKPKPRPAETKKKGFVCTVCGYVYEGDELPADFVCPLCKHGAEEFEPLGD